MAKASIAWTARFVCLSLSAEALSSSGRTNSYGRSGYGRALVPFSANACSIGATAQIASYTYRPCRCACLLNSSSLSSYALRYAFARSTSCSQYCSGVIPKNMYTGSASSKYRERGRDLLSTPSCFSDEKRETTDSSPKCSFFLQVLPDRPLKTYMCPYTSQKVPR